MKLETVMKLIKDNTNCLGYCKSDKLYQSLKDSFECRELRISIVREPSCKVSNKEIFNSILIPVAKAKECLYRESLETLYVFSRSLFQLRTIDRACSLINHQMSETYKFSIVTNYDILAESTKEKEII